MTTNAKQQKQLMMTFNATRKKSAEKTHFC